MRELIIHPTDIVFKPGKYSQQELQGLAVLNILIKKYFKNSKMNQSLVSSKLFEVDSSARNRAYIQKESYNNYFNWRERMDYNESLGLQRLSWYIKKMICDICIYECLTSQYGCNATKYKYRFKNLFVDSPLAYFLHFLKDELVSSNDRKEIYQVIASFKNLKLLIGDILKLGLFKPIEQEKKIDDTFRGLQKSISELIQQINLELEDRIKYKKIRKLAFKYRPLSSKLVSDVNGKGDEEQEVSDSTCVIL